MAKGRNNKEFPFAIDFIIDLDNMRLSDSDGMATTISHYNRDRVHDILEPFPGNVYTIILGGTQYETDSWSEAWDWIRTAMLSA